MKKIISCGLFILMTATTSIFASDNSSYEIVKFSDITQEKVEDYIRSQRSDVIIEFSEGSVLALDINIKGDIITHEPHYSQFKILKTFFINPANGTFSNDLVTWKQKEEFFTGVIDLAYNVLDGIPTFSVNFEINERN